LHALQQPKSFIGITRLQINPSGTNKTINARSSSRSSTTSGRLPKSPKPASHERTSFPPCHSQRGDLDHHGPWCAGGQAIRAASGISEAGEISPLWKRSIFTTKDLPSPDAPTGPNFADNLSLSGIYEIDGAVVAVLVDRVTSQVMEARIGSENEMGIKIRQVTPGASVDKTRIQLQRGDQAGWVSFADPAATQPSEVVQRAVIPTQAPAAGAPKPPPMNRRSPIISNPILPPPAAPSKSDVPLPPP
jgi:hypothetical protein